MPWHWRLARAVTWAGLWFVAFVTILLFGAAVLAGRPLALPVWAVAETETRLNRLLEGHASVSLGGVELIVVGGNLPELRLADVRLASADGKPLAQLPEARARFDGAAMLRGALRPKVLRVTGARLDLRRMPDGSFDLSFGEGAEAPAPASLGALLRQVDEVFSVPALSGLERIEAEALSITLDDRRAGRVWTMGDGRIALVQRPEDMVLDLGFGLVGGGAPATVQLTFFTLHGAQGGRMSARFDQIAAVDLAAQNPALGWLSVLDAPLSGELRAGFDGEGAITGIDGALTLDQGALSPAPEVRPVPLEAARIVFDYDPTVGRIEFSDLSVESPALRLRATGHVDLAELSGAVPGAFLGQIRFDEVRVDPDGVFEEPVSFDQGAMDMRLRLDPFRVDLGQLALVDQGRNLRARGSVAAGADGWEIALDVALDRIRHDRLLALWPVSVVPRTRAWLVNNVQQGLLFDVQAGLRLRPGQEPRLSLGYEFADGDVRFLPTLPPIQGGRGYATIDGLTYTTVVDEGHVTPPEGGRIAVARSVFRVPDISVKPAIGELELHTDSTVTAALSLLDQPPFGFLSRASLRTDLADGRARVLTRIRLPLLAQLPADQVWFDVTAELSGVRSERLVPGRVMQADRLTLRATPDAVTVSGPGTLGAAAFDAVWTLPLEKGRGGQSRLDGSLRIDPDFAREFLPGLPAGAVAGAGSATFAVDLRRGEAPEIRLQSDLTGVALRIAEIGWSKPARASGRLEVEGRLAATPVFGKLLLEGPGLSATGRATLRAGGGLEVLNLSRLRLGEWLDAQAEVAGTGRAAQVRIVSGKADLRRLPEGGMANGRGGSGDGAGAPVLVALDRVQVTDSIALTGVRATLNPGGSGMQGRFSGRLNGQAPVTGEMVQGPKGTGFRIRAEDGGAALAASGLFTRARGGTLDLALVPTGRTGHYDGSIALSSFRVRDMPALAELLNAISIVGLLEQMAGPGLAFAEAQGRFRLTPDAVELTQGSAVGVSFGVSLEGVYHSKADRMDLRGVISPFYLLNGIGAVLTRRGEGLIGFNYRIRGSAAAPQVSVNPLSVLAPAFFRDMLRRPAARLAPESR